MKLSNFFEKIDKMDMGDVIKDFYKSDAPQFKGKSKKKRRDMAIAAKLSAEESVDESGCLGKQIKKGKAKKKSESVEESFKHYKVKHKKSGKEYKITAMHDKSAKEKARAQHGGTASRYSGTSTDDFEIVETYIKEELDLNDNMLGTPDNYYDEEERKEAYEDLKDAMEEFAKGWERESVMNGICPNCAGTGYQDAEYPEYDDDGEEIEDSAFECDGYGSFGCDEGEMVGASWVDIIKHDERNAERQKAKDNYPGDEVVIDQIAKAVKMLDDPRQMYQYMKADYPFMGVAQRSDLIAKGMKKAGLSEGVLDYLTKGIYLDDTEKQNLQFALATMLGKDMDNSLWYKSKLEDLEKELEQKDKNLFVDYLNKKADVLGATQGKSPFMKSLESITEGEERSIIHDATVSHLIDEFSNRVDEMESLEELHDKMYAELEYLDVDEVVDPKMEVGGQPIGDYASGRVIDILDSGSVMEEVTNSLDLSELQDRDPVFPMQYKEGKSPHKKGTKKYKKHMAAMHAEDVDTDSSEADVSKMLAKALGEPNKWSEMSAPELYAELESLDPDMADVIKLTAKMLYDVKLDENTKDKPSKGDCEPCKGTGYKDGKAQDFKTCPVCDGDGEDPGFKGTKAYEEITLDEDQDFTEEFGILGYSIDEENTFEAEYRGRKVKLNKPMRGDVKKFKVYVKDPKTGNVKKVNFGHGGTSAKRPTMRIRKSNPKARKSFRARHNCDNPGPKTKARYWSCRKW
tara:strand:+ start:198 stop:2426 length:2229 start_codon:yes stop_codon:yes gene_type:complete